MVRQSLPNYNENERVFWQAVSLPNSWADEFTFSSLKDFIRFARHVLGKRQRVILPEQLPGIEKIPKYALQEFHNLPNGNFSNKLTPGYIRGFDISMLNTVHHVRKQLAAAVKYKSHVVDIGCAGGKTAAVLKECGVDTVWGIDPSPYLLNQACQMYSNIRFIQASAEDTGIDDEQIDGITACFVLHEIPPKYRDLAIKEFHRILKDDGILAIAEPSSIQYQPTSPWKLFQQWGFKGIYFWILAKFVFEPFVASWHQMDIPLWLAENGFHVTHDQDECPTRIIIAEKMST